MGNQWQSHQSCEITARPPRPFLICTLYDLDTRPTWELRDARLNFQSMGILATLRNVEAWGRINGFINRGDFRAIMPTTPHNHASAPNRVKLRNQLASDVIEHQGSKRKWPVALVHARRCMGSYQSRSAVVDLFGASNRSNTSDDDSNRGS